MVIKEKISTAIKKLVISIKRITPKTIAILYSVSSILFSFAFSFSEDSLFNEKKVIYDNDFSIVYPLIDNYSTILDFFILNPLVIYFFFLATKISFKISKEKKWNLYKPNYHNLGLLVLSCTLSIVFMKIYYAKFLSGSYFDAIIMPVDNEVVVTLTGKIVFFWTSLFISIALFCTFLISKYIIKIISLTPKDVDYQPNSPDGVGGQKQIVTPILTYAYGLIFLLIIYIIFGLYDYLLNDIDESIRVLSSIGFILLIIIYFILPLYKVHNLMLSKKDEFCGKLRKKVDQVYKYFSEQEFAIEVGNKMNIIDDITRIEYINKYHFLSDSLPIYPVKSKKILFPAFGLLISILQLIFDLINQLNL